MSFLTLPPETNSLRMFSGAGPEPMLLAAAAWDGLAAELASAMTSFSSVTSGLVDQAWQGPAATAMTAAAAPYAGWLQAAAAQASGAAVQAKAVASEFESALAATVHPMAVAANRSDLVSLVTSNWFGQNASAIAATESQYEEMWAQDASAMVGYHGGAAAAAAQLTPPPAAFQSLPGIGQVVNAISGGPAAVQAAFNAAPAAAAQAASTNPVSNFLQQLETAQINFNTNLINGEMIFNRSLVTNELALEERIFGTNVALNGFVNRSFNAANLLWGTGQQTINTIVGAQVPTTFTSNLLIGGPQQVFNSGQIGGLLGAFDQSLAAAADLVGFFGGGGA